MPLSLQRTAPTLLLIAAVLSLLVPAAGSSSGMTRQPQLALQIGHFGATRCVSYSQDDRFLASGGDDRWVRVWSAQTGELLHSLDLGERTIAVAFSPDSSHLVAGGQSRVRTWDTRTWKRVHEFSNGAYGWTVALSFDRSAGWFARVLSHRWELQRPDGGSGSGSREAQVRSLSHTAGALSPDGMSVAVVNSAGEILLSGLGDGERRVLARCPESVKALTFTHDDLLAAAVGAEVHLWNVKTGERIAVLKGHSAPVTSIGVGWNTLLTGSRDGTVRLWEVSSRECASVIPVSPRGVISVSPSADRVHFAAVTADGSLRLLHLFGKQAPRELASTDPVLSVSFSPDGRHLLTAGGQARGYVRVWDPGTGELRRTHLGHTGGVRRAVYSPDGQSVASCGSYFGEVRLWNAENGSLIRSFDPSLLYYDDVAFSPRGDLLAGATHRRVRIWKAKTGELLHTLEAHGGWVTAVAFSPDGTRLATSGSDGTVKLWDTRTGSLQRTLRSGEDWMSSVAFSPDGRRVAAGSWDDSARIWDTATGRLRVTLRSTGKDINCIAFSPDGVNLAGGNEEGFLEIWNSRTGKLNYRLEGHREQVTSVTYSPNGRTLSSGAEDGQVMLWDPVAGRLLVSLLGLPGEQFSSPGSQSAFQEPDEHLALTPQGYYSGSVMADRRVRLRLGDSLFTAECFLARYYRPDLVRQALQGMPLPAADPLRGPLPPRISFVEGPLSSEDVVVLTFEAEDDTGLERVELWMNGRRVDDPPVLDAAVGLPAKPIRVDSKPIRVDSKPIRVDSKPVQGKRPLHPSDRRCPGPGSLGTHLRRTVRLPVPETAGTLRIQAVAYDEDELQSPRAETLITLPPRNVERGRLLALCAGISRHRDLRLNLAHAASDARAIAGALRSQQEATPGQVGLYTSASVTALTDENATLSSLRVALSKLVEEAESRDTVVLFLSGHGWRGAGRDFYFATHDVNRFDPARTALPWSEVAMRIQELSTRSRRVIVLLDACHSGSAATNEDLVRALRDANASVLVLASSRGSEESLESPDLRHGLFTRALLEGIAGKAAPTHHGGIPLRKLIAYVQDRVAALSEGRQRPQIPYLQDFDTDAPIVIRR